MLITKYDPIECGVCPEDGRKLLPCLSYPAIFYTQGKFKKQRREYRKDVFHAKDADNWFFYTGLLPRVEEWLHTHDIVPVINATVSPEAIFYSFEHPNLNGIKFRVDQIHLISKAREKMRGIIKSPTGSGKTLLQLGVISTFSSTINVLILAHTISIVEQTAQELKKFGFTNMCILTGNHQEKRYPFHNQFNSPFILVSTIQSYSKLSEDERDNFDMIIVDEAHHVSSFSGQYAEVLSKSLAPYRLGFTATLPTKAESVLAMEAFLGPVIGEYTIDEATNDGVLAIPRIRILKSNYNHNIRELRRYFDVYQKGIVKNGERNLLIMNAAFNYTRQGKTILIIVKNIEHGELLEQMGKDKNLRIKYVQGKTESEDREIIKDNLNQKKLNCVIATACWREGINIPSLAVVINAAGGKSEIQTLQAIGRGLRKTEDKTEVIIVDVFDPSHPYLISHFGERITLYCENKWL